jgi:hypothetical protein
MSNLTQTLLPGELLVRILPELKDMYYREVGGNAQLGNVND